MVTLSRIVKDCQAMTPASALMRLALKRNGKRASW